MENSKKTILLVEDDALISMLESRILKNGGYNVITASNGEEAIDIVNKNKSIDLILMDIDLGAGMDGTESAQEILKTHNIPVVFLSGHIEKEMVEKTEKITSYGYIVKNSGETVLLTSIKMAFNLYDAYMKIERQRDEIEAYNCELEASFQDLEETNRELMEYQEKLKENEEKYKSLFDNMTDGFAFHKIICDSNGKPIDYVFLEVNDAFEKLTGLKKEDIIGKTAKEVLPNLEDHWIEMYGKVALTGESINCENYSKDLGKYYLVKAYSPKRNYFAVIFEDVTGLKVKKGN